ncbi:PLP-dependent aminotransferase family protein [Streptomyces sp. NBC_01186]|uniref:aminotransferase-like domain-containing protein n=1 Tax=unclassified Streptomyces TaxID=2593676 RepID=UPI002DDB0B2A|nr:MULTISPECIES: PLP-dependent aminotransferase family protein [unclassified Streptomyces]WSB79633.1 PLP-dependent aminotransferase family protein [Streptomyces sp. NBC_01775]WSS12164.1 PLP-dependent aminotransferase family protein [Streptomyces sp. NBC_01186]
MEPMELAERLGRWSSGRGPLHALLSSALRRLIEEGELPAGAPLPPDRALAAALAVARGTVIAAYETLRAEDRIERRQGSGTRVAGTPGTPPQETTAQPAFLHLMEPRDGVLMHACAAPQAPPPELVDAYSRILPRLAATTGDIGYHPAGHPVLREAVAEDYTRRGLPTGPDQIMVTNGGQHALALLARALLTPGDRVLVEAPTYPGALEAFREEAAVPRALPPGLAGFAEAVRDHRPALAYAVPTFHNPTGATLPPAARRALAEAAAADSVPLIDDEVLARLPFPGEEVPPPLASHAPEGTVLSVGSLSKLVWGGLRVGWVRATPQTVARLARLRAVHDIGGNIPAQLVAAELLPALPQTDPARARERAAGHDRLRAQLARHLPDWEAPPVRGGQTLWVRLPRGDGAAFAQTALRHGVAVLPGAGLDAGGGSREFLRLHFRLDEAELAEGVRRLARAWHAYDDTRRPTAARPVMAV